MTRVFTENDLRSVVQLVSVLWTSAWLITCCYWRKQAATAVRQRQYY